MMLHAPLTQYAIAPGHDVLLASLHNVEALLNPVNRARSGGVVRRIGIASPPLDLYPVREPTLDGYERGDGMADHEWSLVLGTFAWKHWLDLYFAGGSTISTPFTLYTPDHEQGDYVRCNAIGIRPSRKAGDVERLRGGLFRIRQRFNDLEVI